ncbi:LysR family transcriptional regulator [Kushneria phosphatilytica]|uniref:LysR family transcriptional regulator n=1 Tax=Kushneria phosphatilytica TaxID=657387 RepID=A0A1S1NSV5_9GAMM|nr:LysR family transcriptional regulator [Kushneria phosphatilytica]OHV08693.1 LysR family transcriptional regulator [Kushneria phosphatilytica]QEL12411.1 LysR family transcriptional regulator [Kushneria phosphatilytica]
MRSTLEEHQAFIAVVDAGSITAAAEQLGQTTSGVSRALNRLERKLATTLLRRTTRRLELTEEGREFLEHARAILAAVEAAEEAMALHHQQPVGRLRVNAAPTFMQHVMVPLIGEFRARYPGITLELDTHDRFIDLLEQRTDVAIRIGELNDSSLHARPLGRSRLQLLAAPGYLARHGTPQGLADLSRHTLLGFNQLTHLNRWPLTDDFGGDLTISPDLAASSATTLRSLALAEQGIVCLGDYTTVADRHDGRLVPVLEALTQPRFQAINAVYYRNTALAQRITLLLDFLGERLSTLL